LNDWSHVELLGDDPDGLSPGGTRHTAYSAAILQCVDRKKERGG
jgi:hypothetical protein